MLIEVCEVVYCVRRNAGEPFTSQAYQSEGECSTRDLVRYSSKSHMSSEQLKMLHIIGSSIVRGHGWDFEFGWHRVAQHPLRKRQVHALKHTLYHRGLFLHLVGHGPTFVFQFTVHGAPVFLVRCNLRLLVVALKPLVRVSHISPLRSNFFLRRNITLVISTFMHHSFVIRRGLHWVVRSRFVRFHVFQISSVVRIINPFTLKRAIYTKGDF
jgi:hypothetical protein